MQFSILWGLLFGCVVDSFITITVLRAPSFTSSYRLYSSKSDDTEVDSLQQALYQRELEEQKSSWLGSVSRLPFECTSCGKCCRTIGNVYMSPEELSAAADFMNMTTNAFIETYGERKMKIPSEQESRTWILLKNVERENGPACVFLDDETNHCKIYQVRLVQCSTYPFWTNVMESEYHWNSEVRRTDDDLLSSLPEWTAEIGGCEGMKLLDEQSTSETESGIPLNQALEELSLYQRSDRRLPRGVDFEPV